MNWVARGRLDRSIWKCVQYMGIVVIRPRNDVLPTLWIVGPVERTGPHISEVYTCWVNRF